MVDETAQTLRAEIDHYRPPAPLVTDAGVRAEIEKIIEEELEQRVRDLEERRTAPVLSTRTQPVRGAQLFRDFPPSASRAFTLGPWGA